MTGYSSRLRGLVGKGGFVYASMVGASIGVTAAGVCFVYRVGKVFLFDEEYNRMISRQRYLEKQTIFFANLQHKLQTHSLANSLVSQFNPLDLNLPLS